MKVDLHPRLRKSAAKLSTSEREQIVACLQALANGFGHPHHHMGLGIRRLRKNLFECRAGLRLRVVFFAEKHLLTAFDVMTHDQVTAWLRTF